MQEPIKNRLLLISVLLLMWNPIIIWLFSKNIVLAILLPLCIICIGFIIQKAPSMRLKVWAFNLCCICSILFNAEVLFTGLYADKDIPNLYELRGNYYFNRPNLDQKFHDSEFISRYRTNTQGYRIDNLTSQEQTITQCDWLFIGDSYTQGAQVDFADLFSSLLYADFPDKIIVNAGISGAGLYDELNYFKDKGKELSPKIVFLQIGAFNDFTNVKEHRAGFQEYLMEWSSLYRFFQYNIANTDELPLGRWTEPFFPNIEDNIDNNIFFKQTSSTKEADKLAVKKCIIEFKKEVEKVGGKLVLLFIPSKEQVSPQLLTEVLRAYNIDRNEIDLSIPGELCRVISESENIHYIDLYPDFKQSEAFPFFVHDEHLNKVGHQIIAERIKKEFSSASNKYELVSASNTHDRYPTLYADGTLLYQSQTEDYFLIKSTDINSGETRDLWQGVSELIHPLMSQSKQFLVFTEGDQEHSETDVILYDHLTNKQKKLNDNNYYGAIPHINHSETQLVYPEWKKGQHIPYLAVYDINTNRKLIINDGAECWRPIFSANDSGIFYIQKETTESKFIIKYYDFKTKVKQVVLKRNYDIWDIALSPSGKFIAYAGNKDGNWDLFLYSLETHKITQITHTLGDEWDPSFGIDDNDLWFAGVFGFNDGIYHIELQ